MRCTQCGAIMRRDDTFHGTTDAPVHDACAPSAKGEAKAWDLDNGEVDDDLATEEAAIHAQVTGHQVSAGDRITVDGKTFVLGADGHLTPVAAA